MIKFLEEGSPELKAKLGAIQSLIDHLDESMMNERSQMKMSKSRPKGQMMEEMTTSSDEPVSVEVESEYSDGEEGKLMTPGESIHNVTKMEDNPMMDAENPETAMEMSSQMREIVNENDKYRPRVQSTEKGMMFPVKKQGFEVPMSSRRAAKTARK